MVDHDVAIEYLLTGKSRYASRRAHKYRLSRRVNDGSSVTAVMLALRNDSRQDALLSRTMASISSVC